MSNEDIILEAEDRMSKALEVMNSEFKTIRTGRSNPALIENVIRSFTRYFSSGS